MKWLQAKIRRLECRHFENAGELKIPMTTGLLVGIGESSEELNRFSIYD